MNKIIQIKHFNNILDKFFDFLEHDFSMFNSDIILIKNYIDILKNSNPRLVVEEFMSCMKKYSKQIFECDEDFFINFNDKTNKINNSSNYNIEKLKQIWINNDITQLQKASIFLYFQKLLKIGEKI